ncbi:MAG TPA: PIN domain-containing protein [Tepidisphaeraceae bacterium]|jgi:tRNA(fMet)-specific endonuclease VapC
MERRLVDTNVVSYLLKQDTRAELYRKHLEGRRLYVSFMTVAEIYCWMVERQWSRNRIEGVRRKLAAYRTLIYDDEMAWKWAEVMAIKGHPIAPGDAWIAACALRHGMPLVTHNRSDFEHVPDLTVISEA